MTLREQLDLTEIAVIKQALENAGGSRTLAAVVLGVSLRTLYYKLKRHKITVPAA